MPSSARPTHGFLAALAVAGALIGCAEEPSFEFSWEIDPREGVAQSATTSAKHCSEVGIEKVRLEVYGVDDPDELVFTHDYPCYPTSADGPTLAAGEYTLDLIGLRRNGGEWLCPGLDVDDEGQPIHDVPCVRASSSVTVREGSLAETDKFMLDPPAQCDDGVDNDRDGRVDGSDPACELDFGALEDYDSGRTLFQLTVGILANPLIEPRHVHIGAFEFAVDGMPLATDDPDASINASWPWEFPLLDMKLAPGAHTLSMVAVESVASPTALTDPLTYDFSVATETGAFVIHEFVLQSADFKAPIVDPLAVEMAVGDSIGAPPCGPAGAPIDDMRVRVREGDAPLSLDVGDLVGTANEPLVDAGVEPEGWLAFACSNGGRLYSTAELGWTETGYSIEIEGRIGGVTCFASGISPLRPGSFDPVGVIVSPVLDDEGMPPAGCPN